MSTIDASHYARFNDLYELSQLDDSQRLRGTRLLGQGTRVFQREGKGNVLERTYNALFGRKDLKSHVDKALDEVRGFASDPTVSNAIAQIKAETRKTSGDLKVGQIKQHLANIHKVIGQRPPSISHVPSIFGKTGAIEAAVKIGRAGTSDLEAMIKPLAKAIARDLAANESLRFAFSIADPEPFKNELVAALKKAWPDGDDKELREVARYAFQDGVNMACGIKCGNCIDEQDFEGRHGLDERRTTKVQTFTMNGVEYALDKAFGGASTPSVVGRFIPVKDGKAIPGGKPVILKFLNGGQNRLKGQEIAEVATEALMQRHLNTKSRGKFGKLENVMRLPDGRIGLVLEYFPNGDMYGLIRKLRQAVADMKLHPSQAESIRRTLVKDALESLAAMEDADVSHMDIKGPNFFIGEDGRATLADFGTARLGAIRRMLGRIANMTWNDPKARILADKLPAKDAKKVAAARAPFEQQIAALTVKFEAELPAKLSVIHDNRARRREETRLRGQFERYQLSDLKARAKAAEEAVLPSFDLDARAADRWSLGTMIWEIYSGTTLFDVDQATMAKWRVMTTDAATDRAHDEYLAMSEQKRFDFLFKRAGMPEVPEDIQDIIMNLLDPDPAKRVSPHEALKKPVFQDSAIGSTAVRKLLIALTQHKATADMQWGT